jgi:hypothetical protein
MKLSLFAYRRMLLVYAAVVVVVALVLAFGVIGPVKGDVSLGTTPVRALRAFWANIGLNLLMAAVVIFIVIRSKGRSWISVTGHTIVGFIVIFLGIALSDAASAYRSHGSSMQTATILMYACAAADILIGVLFIITTFLQPKKA